MAGFPFSHKEFLFYSPIEPAASPVPVDRYTPAQLAALPLSDLTDEILRSFAASKPDPGGYAELREWCRKENGTIRSIISGAGVVATPVGRAALKEMGAQHRLVGAGDLLGERVLLEIAYWIHDHGDGKQYPEFCSWFDDLLIGFLPLHPDLAVQARQKLPLGVYEQLFTEQAMVVSGEHPLPQSYTDKRMDMASFSGRAGVPGAVHQLWGPDYYWKYRSQYSEDTNDGAKKARFIVKHLLETGFLTDQRLQVLLNIAQSNVCMGVTEKNGYILPMDGIGAFHLLGSLSPSDEFVVLKARSSLPAGTKRLFQTQALAIDLSKLISPELTQLTIDLLGHLGWKEPASWVLPPLKVLEAVHQASLAGVDDSAIDAVGKVQKTERAAYSYLFHRTLVGKVLNTIEFLAMHLSSVVAFGEDVHAVGLPTTQPVSAHNDAMVSIRGSFPEHFPTIYAREVARLLTEAQEARTRLLERGTPRWADSINRKMEEHYRANRHTHNTFFGSEYAYVTELMRVPTLDEVPHLKIFEQLVNSTVALFESLPKAKTPTDQLVRQAERLLNILRKYFKVNEIYYHGDRGGFNGEGLHQIVEAFETALKMKLDIVVNDLVLQPGVPLTILGANGQGKSSLMAMLIQHLFPTVRMIGAESRTPWSTHMLTAFDGIEKHGKTQMSSGRYAGRSSFMMEVDELIPIFEKLLNPGSVSQIQAGDEIGKRTDQLNGMSLVGTHILLAAAKGAIALNAAHYNTLPTLLEPIMRQCGLSARWATLSEHRLIEGSDVPFASAALENAARFLPRKFVKNWVDHRVETEMPADTADDCVTHTPYQLHKETLQQLGWIERVPGYDREEQLVGLGGFLLGAGASDLRLCQLENQDHKFLHAHFAQGPEVCELLVNTMLNPRWELRERIKQWVAALNLERVQELQGKYQKLKQIINIVMNVQDLRQRRGQMSDSQFQLETASLQIALDELRVSLPQMRLDLEWLSGAYPELTWDRVEDVLRAMQDEASVLEFGRVCGRIALLFEPFFIVQSLCCVVTNAPLIGLCVVEQHDNPNLDARFEDLWGAGLAPSLRRRRESLVKNSIGIGHSTFFAGCQGSGKTEAIIAIAEALTTAQLFNLAPASAASLSAQPFEVLPLISVPQWKQREGKPGEVVMPLSGWQREAANRIAAIVSFCESLPDGVVPVVVLDELGVSTDPIVEGSEIIQIVTQYVEGRGGIVVMSTHCHQALWDMAAKGHPHQVMSVTPFWEENKYRWVPGHGESLGLETAARLGIPPTAIEIAEVLRGYFLNVGAGALSADELTAVQDSTADALKAILSRQSEAH